LPAHDGVMGESEVLLCVHTMFIPVLPRAAFTMALLDQLSRNLCKLNTF